MYHFSNSLLKNTLHSLTKNPTTPQKKEKFWVNFIFYVKQQHKGRRLCSTLRAFFGCCCCRCRSRCSCWTWSKNSLSWRRFNRRGRRARAPTPPPASTCLFSGWEILTSKRMPLGLFISPEAGNAHPSARRSSLNIGHYKGERAGGRAVGRASFPGESKDCDDCLEAKWSQQSEQQTPESNNNSERLR